MADLDGDGKMEIILGTSLGYPILTSEYTILTSEYTILTSEYTILTSDETRKQVHIRAGA